MNRTNDRAARRNVWRLAYRRTGISWAGFAFSSAVVATATGAGTPRRRATRRFAAAALAAAGLAMGRRR